MSGIGAKEVRTEQVDDLADHQGKLQVGPLAVGPAGKGQHLLDQAGAALSAGVQNIHQPLDFGIGAHLPHQVHGEKHRGQDVVEIVRNAAGQGADAFESLRTEQLPLELFLTGDVGTDDQV